MSESGNVLIVREGGTFPKGFWPGEVEKGAWLILEGASPASELIGFKRSGRTVAARSVSDRLRPRVDIVWERPTSVHVFELPPQAQIFASEPWSGAPLVAGFRRGEGGVLWTALDPGVRGYERFPFLLQALAKLGLEPPVRSNRLWAFFDSSYRSRADLDFLATRWKQAGISRLHVAAWQYFEPDKDRDCYLHDLIENCHRHGILVYAWLELPHVSEKFWHAHPEWREKTALLQDARLDWRMLMNLLDPDCFAAAAEGVKQLLRRFDWDGVNLAELYFESLQGHHNPSRFTPMNQQVRQEFRALGGFDPLELFTPNSPNNLLRNPAGLRRFLDYRAALAMRLQQQWIGVIETLRPEKPDLGLVVTHIDDRFERGMRDALGADAAATLGLMRRHELAVLIEDPATVWNLGPERYRRIADNYLPIAPNRRRLGIDLNIVERYQDVYPTKQQVGIELFQMVYEAARAFPQVALYFEHSIQAPDAVWLAAAAAAVERLERKGDTVIVDAPRGVGLRWRGAALVDGKLWPAADGETVWLAPGRHRIEPAPENPPLLLLDLAADLISAGTLSGGLEFTYESLGRTIALLSKRPGRLLLDGKPACLGVRQHSKYSAVALPAGRHNLRAELSSE